MKKTITPFVLIFLMLAVGIAPSFARQNKEVETLKKEIELLQSRVNELSDSVDTGNATLTIAKGYSDSADKLHGHFLYHVDILLAIASFLFLGVLGGTFTYMKNKMNNQLNQRMDEEVEKREVIFKDFLDKKEVENKSAIGRLIKNEDATVYLKENSNILFIHKTNTFAENTAFGQLQDVVFKEFKNDGKTYSPTITDITNNTDFEKLSKSNFPYKLIVMDDDLFSESEDRDKEAFIDALDENNIALVIFGNTRLPKNPSNYAFANNPYSLYNNLNNLLKYMYVVRSTANTEA